MLYDYWRSSASWRVRIALNAAGIPFRSVTVDLLAGDQRGDAHLERNPQGFIPVLEIDGLRLTQSLAIVDHIDETRNAGFLPGDAAGRARVRALAHVVAMDTHPVCNPSVVSEVVRLTDGGDAVREGWMHWFIRRGLAAFERMLADGPQGRFCHGDRPGLADFCLIPQVYNADRWGVDRADLTRIDAIARSCAELPAFAKAHPDSVR